MAKQQTSVEWLEKMINIMISNGGSRDLFDVIDYIQEAKEMEKQQIMDAYDQMRCVGNFENGEQYYTETYGK